MIEPVPVYGQGFFHVHPGEILYLIIFDYLDEDRYYHSLAMRGRLGAEERMLAENMQRLMDEERVIINGADVRPIVFRAAIEFRGDPERPSITFFTRMKYKPRLGINIYENMYDEARAEYDYTVYWIPSRCTRITAIDSPGKIRITDKLAVIAVRRGTRVSGYESVSFEHICI